MSYCQQLPYSYMDMHAWYLFKIVKLAMVLNFAKSPTMMLSHEKQHNPEHLKKHQTS